MQCHTHKVSPSFVGFYVFRIQVFVLQNDNTHKNKIVRITYKASIYIYTHYKYLNLNYVVTKQSK